jgi:hypothetical protein
VLQRGRREPPAKLQGVSEFVHHDDQGKQGECGMLPTGSAIFSRNDADPSRSRDTQSSRQNRVRGRACISLIERSLSSLRISALHGFLSLTGYIQLIRLSTTGLLCQTIRPSRLTRYPQHPAHIAYAAIFSCHTLTALLISDEHEARVGTLPLRIVDVLD